MKRLRAGLFRFAGMLRGGWRERDFADEIASHLQMHVDDNLRAGMTPEQARRQAILKLGGLESTKQAYRERNTFPALEHLLQDLRFGGRQLRKNPGFTVTAILMLALGICASVSIFAFVDAALIKPLPYRDPNRLTGVYESIPMFPQSNLSYPDYLDWKRLNDVFSSLDVYEHFGFLLTTREGPQPARGVRVTSSFFRTLGVSPVLGRDFRAGEDSPAAPRTVMLSYGAWQKRYGGKSDVLRRKVILDGQPNIIIGVLPKNFHFAPAEPAEFWTALHATGGCDLKRSCHSLYGVGRLKDGISMQAALADLQSIARQLAKQYPGSNQGQGASLMPLSEVIVGRVRPIFLVLLSGAGLLLLIACVNVASLLLVRSESRRREVAIRSALGASSVRLGSQFVTEGLLLVAIGSSLGLASAWWAMQFLTRLIPPQMMAGMPYLEDLGFSGDVMAFAGGIALAAAILFALTPAMHLSLSKMREGLAEGGRGSAGNVWRRLGSKLVIVELATATVLLAGAGLLGKSFYRLLHVQLGLQPEHVAMLEIAAANAAYGKDEQSVALARQIVRSVENLPGVKSAAITDRLPVSGNGNTDWIRFPGRPYHGEHNEVNSREVSSEYFKTIGAKLLRGRYFTDAEDASKPRVAIINQALAQEYFPNEDPIGRKFGDDDLSPKSMREIIGIVDDIREGSLAGIIWPAEYLPFNQNPETYFFVVVRAAQTEEATIPALTAAIHRLDTGIVVISGGTLREHIVDTYEAYVQRSSTWLVGSFAAVALLLSVIGLYGVVAYSVGQRTREIGVRMALGAERRSVYRLILKEATWLTGIGVVIGLSCSVGAATFLRSLLFGVRSWDIWTLTAVAALLTAGALLASYFPARRAASVNPLEALRVE